MIAVTLTATFAGVLDDLKVMASKLKLEYIDVDTVHFGKAYYLFAGKWDTYKFVVAIPADVQSPEAMAIGFRTGCASVEITRDLWKHGLQQ